MQIVISPFSEDHSTEIAAWPCDRHEVQVWAGADVLYPLNPAQFRIWHDDPETHAFVAHCDHKLLAYGELWVDEREQEIEFARIIVHPGHRGLGLGQAFVAALIARSATFGYENRILRVLPENTIALRCYEKSGFVLLSIDDQKKFNQEQPVEYMWMKFDPQH